jgi:hypothetical protein
VVLADPDRGRYRLPYEREEVEELGVRVLETPLFRASEAELDPHLFAEVLISLA